MKYYAVGVGLTPGVYSDWAECEKQIKGYKGAKYKSFSTLDEAESFAASFNKDDDKKFDAIAKSAKTVDGTEPVPSSHMDIYVDGSYNSDTNQYGYGVFMTDGVNEAILQGSGQCMFDGRNIEGEVAGAVSALNQIIEMPQYESFTIHHDYEGVGKWADGAWNTNKKYTQDYADMCRKVRGITGKKIVFEHVKGHTGIEGNEYVDVLAKQACGIQLTSSEQKFLDSKCLAPLDTNDIANRRQHAIDFIMQADSDMLSKIESVMTDMPLDKISVKDRMPVVNKPKTGIEIQRELGNEGMEHAI